MYTIEMLEDTKFVVATWGESGIVYGIAAISPTNETTIHVIEHSPTHHKLHFDEHIPLAEDKTEDDVLNVLTAIIQGARDTDVFPGCLGDKMVVMDFRGENEEDFLEETKQKYPVLDFKYRKDHHYLVGLMKGIS